MNFIARYSLRPHLSVRTRKLTPPKTYTPGISHFLLIAAVVSMVQLVPAVAEIPAGYYDAADTTDSDNLRRILHEIIDDHTRHPYTSTSPDTWNILEAADQDPINANNILDVYRNTSISKQGGGNTFYNREHTWPKSYGFPNDRNSNYPYTDCHALFLSDSAYNSSRSNKPYRSCDQTCTEKRTEENNGRGGGEGVHPGNSNWTSGRSSTGTWETWIGRRGDVARALFYMDVRYEGGSHGITGAAEPDLILTDNETLIADSNTGNNELVAHMGMLAVLLVWHQQDPVDDLERRRNDAVFGFQGNRNPFIDHPEWVACAFGDDCSGGAPIAGLPWINELHYDNAGSDRNEFVEIAGPTGLDLMGWLLVGYNGATGSVYRTVQLSGVIPDQQARMGTLAFDFAGLQNGPSDGIALVDPDGTVVEFLSYEGAFTAVNGPSEGRLSVDIGVSESKRTSARESLQKSGNGRSSSEFTWQPESRSTKGRQNTGQTF